MNMPDSSIFLRIAEALERLSPPPSSHHYDFAKVHAWVWQREQGILLPIPHVAHVPFSLLCGIDHVAKLLLENTRAFAQGFPANNALLWGARGMGKSSLVKAIHAEINQTEKNPLILVEIFRDDLPTLPQLLTILRNRPERFVLFCDDLSFDVGDASYKPLKAVLDGGIAGRPDNVVLYATSNRRHLMPRDMKDNQEGSAIHPSEAVEEKVSLSDRFGLWLGIHSCSQEMFVMMVKRYREAFNLPISEEELLRAANEWSITRGARSGRVAWQFIQDIAGKLKCGLKS